MYTEISDAELKALRKRLETLTEQLTTLTKETESLVLFIKNIEPDDGWSHSGCTTGWDSSGCSEQW